MNGVTFLQSLDANDPMPMARPWQFRITKIGRGDVSATAVPTSEHENPFGVAQGGFAATVLDIALGLVSISVLEDADSTMVATTDLFVRYFKPIVQSTGELQVGASIAYEQDRLVMAEAYLHDAGGTRFAYAQSNCLIVRREKGSS